MDSALSNSDNCSDIELDNIKFISDKNSTTTNNNINNSGNSNNSNTNSNGGVQQQKYSNFPPVWSATCYFFICRVVYLKLDIHDVQITCQIHTNKSLSYTHILKQQHVHITYGTMFSFVGIGREGWTRMTRYWISVYLSENALSFFFGCLKFRRAACYLKHFSNRLCKKLTEEFVQACFYHCRYQALIALFLYFLHADVHEIGLC